MNSNHRMKSFLAVLAAIVACVSVLQTRPLHQELVVEYAGSVGVPHDLAGVIPEDVNAQGVLLLLEVAWPSAEPSLLLWDISRRAFRPAIRVDWPRLSATANDESIAGQPQTGIVINSVRFLSKAGNRAVALEAPFIVLVNLGTHRIEKVTKVPGIKPRNLEILALSLQGPVLAVDKEHGRFAVFFNVTGKGGEAFLYSSRPLKRLLSWTLPRYVQDAAWSPDGKKLAVLYSGSYGSHLQFYDADVKRKLLTLPDVAVFDTRTGHLDFSFFSGQPEAQITYSPDGNLLYCIGESGALPMTLFAHHGRDAIRVFSATNGRLVRTIHVPHTGVRSGFALSPDGKLIAADATTNATWVPHDPPPIAVRFVLLDVATGKKLFAHEETWGGGDAIATTLMFSPDGRTLIADPLAADGEGPVEIYRLFRMHSK